MIKRLFALMLVAAVAIACASCRKKPNDSHSSGTKTVVSVNDGSQHYVSETKRLHRVKSTNVGRAFVTAGESDYKIIIGTKSTSAAAAASYILRSVKSVTGYALPIINDYDQDITDWSKQDKYIVIMHDALFDGAEVAFSEEYDIGYSGYMIKTVGDSVFIKVATDYGYQMAALAFLREVVGYEAFSEDCIVYGKDGSTLPDLDVIEKPDFDFRMASSYLSAAGKYAMGVTANRVLMAPGGVTVHNSYVYLPPETYCDESKPATYHPLWYSDRKIVNANRDPSRQVPDQLCYSAHGDKEEYDAMVATASAAMLGYINENPDVDTITFTHEDTMTACKCETCSAATEVFGAVSSTYIMFINDVESVVVSELKRQAQLSGGKERNISIIFFAYHATAEAPVKEGADGTYIPSKNPDNKITYQGKDITLPYNKTYPDGISCNEHVGVWWAPIEANYNKTFYDEACANNVYFKKNLEKWGTICKRIYAWIYDMNFLDFMYPFNSYDTLFETVRLLKDNNAIYIYNEGQGTFAQGSNKVTPCFGALKEYCNQVVAFDVNANYGETVNKFFKHYFREAAAPMREYFDKLTAYLKQLETDYPDAFTGFQKDPDIHNEKYWPLPLMRDYLSLTDKAFAAIEKYKTADAALYEVLRKHILIETIFPRFVLCEHYGGYYSSTAIREMRESFKEDCLYLGIGLYAEHEVIDPYYEKWGIE